jgi:hypothetical protein
MGGAEQEKRRLTLRTPKASRFGGFRNRRIRERATAVTLLDRLSSHRYVHVGKELVGENRGVDRILRRLKLHAEGRQFGDQNS